MENGQVGTVLACPPFFGGGKQEPSLLAHIKRPVKPGIFVIGYILLMKSPFSSRFRFFLPFYARFFIMFVFPSFGQYAGFLARPFEAPEGAVKCFIFANFYFSHYALPPSAITMKPNIPYYMLTSYYMQKHLLIIQQGMLAVNQRFRCLQTVFQAANLAGRPFQRSSCQKVIVDVHHKLFRVTATVTDQPETTFNKTQFPGHAACGQLNPAHYLSIFFF